MDFMSETIVPKIPNVIMNNGVEMPLFGFGTWQAKDEKEIKDALSTALEHGYRLIDTAFYYQNEGIIGAALKEYFDAGQLKRSEVFITTKLPPFCHRAEDVQQCFERQLRALQMDYVDLYLIHTTCSCKKDPYVDSYYIGEDGLAIEDPVDILETWRALEKLYKSRKVRAIGISNFNEEQINRIIDNCEIVPHNHQVECHILLPQNDLFDFCTSKGITFTAYAPLGSPGLKNVFPEAKDIDILHHPKVLKVAEKHQRTPAQILLRQLIQRGICVIPKSTNPGRIIENINIFDFELDDEDMKVLSNVGPQVRLFDFKFLIKHSEYPFKEILEAEEKKENLKLP